MKNLCTKCGNQTMLMSGMISLEPDQEPYESGKTEKPRTNIESVDKCIIAHYCENCDEVINISNE